jgi:hypothetical protein
VREGERVNSNSIWLALILGLGFLSGCERDLPYVTQSDQPISGFQLEGFVTDRLGTPVKGLRIALWYDYDFLDNNTPSSRIFVVDDSSKIARVAVFDQNNKLRRVIYQRKTRLGVLDLDWDKTDSLGQAVSSGIYTVNFSEGGITKSSYTVVVDGAITAVTDSLGHYIITNDSLPVNFYPAPLYTNDDTKFLGNFQITPYIRLEFYLDIHRSANVSLIQDQVTRFDFRI